MNLPRLGNLYKSISRTGDEASSSVYVWVRDLKLRAGTEDEAPRGMCPRHKMVSYGELERVSAGSQGRRVS